jgi:hypothetical protein
LAARNACTERNTARTRRFKLLRDLKAVEKGIGQNLSNAELILTFNEWHRLSEPFLDPAKTRTDQRCLPWLSRHSHGDSNVTGGEFAAPMQRGATAAIVNVARVIAPVHITLSLPCGEQKRQN